MRHNKKSQIVVTDLIVAMFIFLLLLTAIMLVWNRYVVIANKQAQYEEAQLMAFQVSDILVKTKGKPTNWEEDTTNVHIIGLAYTDRNLSSAKVNAFFNMNYNDTKKTLNIDYYDFSFQINDLGGSNLTGVYGKNATGDFIINLRRYILYENEKAILEFRLWE